MDLEAKFLFALIAGPLLALALFALAALHLIWALGGTWLIAHQRVLLGALPRLDMAAGNRAKPTHYILASLLLLAGLWPLMITGLLPSPLPIWSLFPLGVVFWLGFLLRGIFGYEPTFQGLNPEEPFATRNLVLYSPLFLSISMIFALFLFGG